MTEDKELSVVSEQDKAEIFELFDKVDKDNPAPEDLRKVKAILSRNPHLWGMSKGVADSNLSGFIGKITNNKFQQLIFEAEALSKKERLGYNSSSQIEKLIIDEIISCWVGLRFVETNVFAKLSENGVAFSVFNFWQETLSRYQNRHLKAIETLARVRKLSKGIAFQVNIATDGGQQVNVGEVKKGV